MHFFLNISARSQRTKGVGRLLVVIIEGHDLKASNNVTGKLISVEVVNLSLPSCWYYRSAYTTLDIMLPFRCKSQYTTQLFRDVLHSISLQQQSQPLSCEYCNVTLRPLLYFNLNENVVCSRDTKASFVGEGAYWFWQQEGEELSAWGKCKYPMPLLHRKDQKKMSEFCLHAGSLSEEKLILCWFRLSF